MTFSWESRDLNRNLKELGPKLDLHITAIVDFQATRGEALLKTGAPWTDRTGAARVGLHTTSSHVPMKRHEITFAHMVFYGIWLEVANRERYAIILQTVRQVGRDTMQQLSGLFGRTS